MSRYTWIEHVVGPFTVVVRRSRSRHYTARVYRGRALSALLIGLASIDAFMEEAA